MKTINDKCNISLKVDRYHGFDIKLDIIFIIDYVIIYFFDICDTWL